MEFLLILRAFAPFFSQSTTYRPYMILCLLHLEKKNKKFFLKDFQDELQNTRIDITLQQASHYDNCHNANELRPLFQIKTTAEPLVPLQLRSRRIECPVDIRRPEKEQDIRRNEQQRLRKQNRRHKQKPLKPVTHHCHRQQAPRRKPHIADINAKKRHSCQSRRYQT